MKDSLLRIKFVLRYDLSTTKTERESRSVFLCRQGTGCAPKGLAPFRTPGLTRLARGNNRCSVAKLLTNPPISTSLNLKRTPFVRTVLGFLLLQMQTDSCRYFFSTILALFQKCLRCTNRQQSIMR